MPTQTIALTTLPNLPTPTLKVFPDGSDTAAAGSPFTLVEATNAKGRYSATFTGTLAGLFEVFVYSSSVQVTAGWVGLANADGTYTATAERSLATVPGDGSPVVVTTGCPTAPTVRDLVWKVEQGRAFAYDLKFCATDADGNRMAYDLTGRTVVVTIGTTVYRSGVDARLTVPTPPNGIAQFRLADADTANLTDPRYPLAVDIDNGTGSTTRYWDGVVFVE